MSEWTVRPMSPCVDKAHVHIDTSSTNMLISTDLSTPTRDSDKNVDILKP